ncbi:MAG: YigZ family protein [Muribaculaceae bacterium]|nr:YigZ family protein [Muribaculaceae bacterium]
MGDTYYTIASPGEGIYREKMSKFMAFALPVQTVDGAREIISEYTNRFHDARHVCWAYMIGASRTTFLSSDNGEPSGTAGKPILGQINSFNLTNIVIVVVRYFGGIKLGPSGLIAAYREAAREAISSAPIIECHEQETISFNFPYLSMEPVMRLVKNTDLDVIEQIFDNSCRMTVQIRADHAPEFTRRLLDIDGLTLR